MRPINMNSGNTRKIVKLSILMAVTIFAALGAVAADENLRAPEFTASTLEGTRVSLRQERGKVVFLSFFASWCVPCRNEAPMLNSLKAEFPDAFQVFSIGYRETNPANLKNTAAKFALKVPVLIDAKETIAQGYRVAELPVGILLDEFGYIIRRFNGITPESEKDLKDLIRARIGRLQTRKKHMARYRIDTFKDTLQNETSSEGTAAKVTEAIRKGIAAAGYQIESPDQPADFTLSGNVSELGPIAGVEIVLKEAESGHEIDRMRASVAKGNTSAVVNTCVKMLRDVE